MKLYNYFRSSASFRVRIALELKGLGYDYVPVHLVKGEHKQEAYAAVSPSLLVPTLELDGGERLGQSMAIIEYLDETHPEPPLLPRDAAGPRAGARAGAADRLRDPSAEQPARAQVPGARTEGGRGSQERLVPPLGARRPGGFRARTRAAAAPPPTATATRRRWPTAAWCRRSSTARRFNATSTACRAPWRRSTPAWRIRPSRRRSLRAAPTTRPE